MARSGLESGWRSMSRSAWTILVSLVIFAVSLAMALTRRAILAGDLDGPRSNNGWKVTLVVSGNMGPGETSIHTPLPLDFRRQHTRLDEATSKELSQRSGKGKHLGLHELTWQRDDSKGKQPFRIQVTSTCYLGMRRQTVPMAESTQILDARPEGKSFLQVTPEIERDDPEIQNLARKFAEEVGENPRDLAQVFYEYVLVLDDEPFVSMRTARDTLRVGGAGSAGKSRLLVALLRNRGIPSRVLSGLVLTADQEPRLHYWVEAWIDQQWFPLDPTQRHFGPVHWPHNYLILQLDDEPLVRGLKDRQNLQFGFRVENLHDLESDKNEAIPGRAKLWQVMTFHGLRRQEQHLVRFLLLLPLAALIVTLFRTIVGIPTYGTFTPALLGLVFLDMRALPIGLPIFVCLILIGWGIRHLLDRFHLLQVPRASALLTLIVVFILLLTLAASRLGLAITHYISLFPLVILTHLVERFWTVEMEDGTYHSFRTLFGTIIVSVTTSLCLGPKIVGDWMFRYPETLGAILAILLLLGRYTGYRISELYRFGDLLTLVEAEKKHPTPLVTPDKKDSLVLENPTCSPGGSAGGN